MDKNTFGNPKKKEHGWFLSLNYACFFSGVFLFIFVFLLFVYLFFLFRFFAVFLLVCLFVLCVCV